MITINKLQRDEVDKFVDLIKVMTEVFETENFTMPPRLHLERVLSKGHLVVFIASEGDRVVGGLTAHVLEQYYVVKPLLYIYDLAVDETYQRKGIGQRLIKASKDYAKSQGVDEVYVPADEDDDQAIAFYRKTQPTREEQVMHFSYVIDDKK